MTTQLKTTQGRTVSLSHTDNLAIFRFQVSDNSSISRWVNRSDFIAAIESELGGTWIDDADLPDVVNVRSMDRFKTLPDDKGVYAEYGADPATYERLARHHLAIARHLRAHPPVDEAEVKALYQAILAWRQNEFVDGADIDSLARRLVATGKVHVDVEGAARG